MKIPRFARCLIVLSIGLCAWGLALAQDSKPNIIFIMADDLGNTDLGYRGGEIKTPKSTSSPLKASVWSRSTDSRFALHQGPH